MTSDEAEEKTRKMLKPPSLGMWLALAMYGLVFGHSYMGFAEPAAPWLALAGGLIALGTVVLWIGRCVGVYGVLMARSAMEGIREGMEEERERREGRSL